MIIIFLICHLLLNKLTYIIYLYLGNNYVFLIGQCQLTLEIHLFHLLKNYLGLYV